MNQQHQAIRSALQNIYGFTNAQQMILNAEAMYGPLRPVRTQTSMNRTVEHVINSHQEFMSLPQQLRKQKLEGYKKTKQQSTKIRKDLVKHLVEIQVATSVAHANAMIQYVEFLSKTKLKAKDLEMAIAFFFKYYVHPRFQDGFMQYVMDHSVEFYEYLMQLSPGKAPQAMSQTQRNKLKKISGKEYLSKQGKGGVTCPICMQDFQQQSSLIQLPCHHVFHEDQIKQWLKVNKKCPLCGT